MHLIFERLWSKALHFHRPVKTGQHSGCGALRIISSTMVIIVIFIQAFNLSPSIDWRIDGEKKTWISSLNMRYSSRYLRKQNFIEAANKWKQSQNRILDNNAAMRPQINNTIHNGDKTITSLKRNLWSKAPACFVWKSSNWIRARGQRSFTAAMNSSDDHREWRHLCWWSLWSLWL